MAARRERARERSQVRVEIHRAHAAEDVLKAALKELKWKNISVSSASHADIYWRTMDRDDDSPVPEAASYIARIPGMSTVVHKAEMSKHVNRLRRFFPDQLSFYPKSWVLPEEQDVFEDYVHRHKGKTYIVKPDQGAQGEGIFLMQNARDLRTLKVPSIAQEYISRPLLVDGLKFDLRIYVLVASLCPLEVLISESGMARFCTMPYESPSVKNMHQTFMHLTNYSLNKRSKDYVQSEQGGSKQSLKDVLAALDKQGCDTIEIWRRVEDLVCKTLIALLPQLMVEQNSYMVEHGLKAPENGFQVLGFDILLDAKSSPHLLEVNAHPSLRVDFEQPVKPGVVEYVPSAVDMEIKLPVVRDTLKVIGKKILQRELSCAGTCLKELLPSSLDQFSELRVFEKCAELFCKFVGARGGLKMGSSAFRHFTRQCKLVNDSFTNADVDILYIDVCRNHSNTYERNALSFHGFCSSLAVMCRKLYGSSSLETLTALCDRCAREF